MNHDFNFGLALMYAKQGHKIARRGWNGKGLHVEAQFPDADSKMGNPYLFIDARELGGECNPWVPSQTDLFGEDWFIVDGASVSAAEIRESGGDMSDEPSPSKID